MLTITIVITKKYNTGRFPKKQLTKILYAILKGLFCNCPQRSSFFMLAWAFGLELELLGIWGQEAKDCLPLKAHSTLQILAWIHAVSSTLSFILHSREADHEASLHSNCIIILSNWKPSRHLDFQKLVGREEPLCIGKKININCSYTRHDCIWETYNPAQTENYVYKHWKKLIFFKQLRDSQYFIIPSFLMLSFSFIATFPGSPSEFSLHVILQNLAARCFEN